MSCPENKGYETKLCGCFSDIQVCCLSFWCPCVVFGQTSESVLGKEEADCLKTGATFAVPCIVLYIIGQILSAIIQTDISFLFSIAMGCYTGYMGQKFRAQYRAKWGYPEDKNLDFVCYFCCEPCSIGQDALESKAKGKVQPSPSAPPQPEAPVAEAVAVPVAEPAMTEVKVESVEEKQ